MNESLTAIGSCKIPAGVHSNPWIFKFFVGNAIVLSQNLYKTSCTLSGVSTLWRTSHTHPRRAMKVAQPQTINLFKAFVSLRFLNLGGVVVRIVYCDFFKFCNWITWFSSVKSTKNNVCCLINSWAWLNEGAAMYVNDSDTMYVNEGATK